MRPLPLLLLLPLYTCALAQPLPPELKTGYAPLDEKLARLVTVDEFSIGARAARELSGAVFLDAREPEEYRVSHLPAARPLGYRNPDWSQLGDVNKDRPVVVYCTVGYRSERMATRLRRRGFTKVYNLYGSLYAWALAGLPLEDDTGRRTKRLHTYNAKWGAYLPADFGEQVH